MKKILLYLSCAAAALLTIMIGVNYHYYNLKFTCSGTMQVYKDNNAQQPLLSLNQEISLYWDGTVINQITGELLGDNQNYEISRTAFYVYKKISGWQYDLQVTDVIKSSIDSVPEKLEKRHLEKLSSGSRRIIGVNTLLDNNYLFSFNNGPYFVCAKVYR